MNRNKKRPDRDRGRRRHGPTDRTKNARAFRITASWDAHPDRPALRQTSDRHARDRMARDFAAQGGYVIVEEHQGRGQWRTLYELDGPAQLAEQRAAEEHAEAERRARLAEQARRARLAAEATNTARVLMTPPAIVRTERRARHVTGAQR